MTLEKLRKAVLKNVFHIGEVEKIFWDEPVQTVRTQLSRFARKGLVKKIKRGWYCFDDKKIDEMDLSARLYQPSYISLETALNYYGLIPDVYQGVTGITVTATKKIVTSFGTFYYTKISPKLFWGYTKVKSSADGTFFNMAKKEKAVLDYFYIRKIKNIDGTRLNLGDIDRRLYGEYAKRFPPWVGKINI